MSAPYYADDAVTLYLGDCLDVLAELPDASVDAVVTDPPYSLSFMGKSWDEHAGRDDAALGYWLAGFIDGEGCFTVKGHNRGTFAPSFAIKLRRDDRAALIQAQRFVGAGQVRDTEGDGVSKPQVRWAIQDREGCQRLVDVLDKYPLRAKKRLDYISWREAVCEWTDRPRGNRWHGATDQTRMAGLRERTAFVKGYADPPWSGHEFQDWCRLWATECLRVLKPGGHLLSFGGTRTYHRLACAIEDAGFEIRDSIAWLYGSGFPKSLDVSKAIDKAAGAEREVVGRRKTPTGSGGVLSARTQAAHGYRPEGREFEAVGEAVITAPATDDARTWAGWGTALKPAFEPIVVARKPLAAGTVAANVLQYGTGALNVDACRVGYAPDDPTLTWGEKYGGGKLNAQGEEYRTGDGTSGLAGIGQVTGTINTLGRWPANVTLDDTQAAELDRQSGTSSSPGTYQRGTIVENHIYGASNERPVQYGHGDSGGASRFFPTFQAARHDPACGWGWCENMDHTPDDCGTDPAGPSPDCEFAEWDCAPTCPLRPRPLPTFRYEAKAPTHERPRHNDHAAHPTVKPLDLMRWLVRLVTPPGGTVLDPFAGSGTTAEACVVEGFSCITIEREADYLPLIVARLTKPIQVSLFGDETA